MKHFLHFCIHVTVLVELSKGNANNGNGRKRNRHHEDSFGTIDGKDPSLAFHNDSPLSSESTISEGGLINPTETRSANERFGKRKFNVDTNVSKTGKSAGAKKILKSERNKKSRSNSQGSKKSENRRFHPSGTVNEDYIRKLPIPERLEKSKRPNIVLLLTDDLDIELGSLNYMPKLLRAFGEGGAMFSNAYTSTPMCCPSRSSMLTGMYIHNHHVYTNHQNCSSPVWQDTHERNSFASYLSDAGYKTGYFGKYLNRYKGKHVPPGWQDWGGLLMNSRYYNYTVNRNNVHVKYGNKYPHDYYPHVVTKDGIRFLNSTSKKDPFLLVLSYPSPHGPEDSAPEHAHKFFNAFDHHTASYNYAPNPDKQWVLQFTDRMPEIQLKFTDLLMTKRLQTLQTIDSAIERILKVVDDMGESDNTYFFFTSDHGYHLGQYGLTKGKAMPFEFDIKVPFLVKGPGVQVNSELPQLALNVDLAPTFLDIAGITRPSHMDGRSLLPILKSSTSPQDLKNISWRDSFLVESSGRYREEGILEKIEQRTWERERVLTKTLFEASSYNSNLSPNHSVNLYTSKHERLEEVCKRREFSYPCLHDQKWHCLRIKKRWKIKKCRQKTGMWQKHCVCNYEQGFGTFTKLESRERRKQKNFLKKYGSQDFHQFDPKFVKAFRNLKIPMHSTRPKHSRRRFGRSLSEGNVTPEILEHNSSIGDSVHTFVEEEEIRDLEEQIEELSFELENLKRAEGNQSSSFITGLENWKLSKKCHTSNSQTCRRNSNSDKLAIKDDIRRLKQQLTAMKNILSYFQEKNSDSQDFNSSDYDDDYFVGPPVTDSIHLKSMPGHIIPPDANFNMTEMFQVLNESVNNDVIDSFEKQSSKEGSRTFLEQAETRSSPKKLYPIRLTDLLGQENKGENNKVCWCNEKIFRKMEIKKSRERRRKERMDIKHVRNRKRRRKKKEKAISCNFPKLNCYTHNNQHWKTPPLWTNGDFCFCINSANNTYWCVRTINETHNTLYCEFITGLITYYDLHIDPYQLRNVAFTLSTEKVSELHKMLTRLRSCTGADECDGVATETFQEKKKEKPLPPEPSGNSIATLLMTDKFEQLSKRAKMSQRRIKKERRKRKQIKDEMFLLEQMVPFPMESNVRHPRKSRHDRKDRKSRHRRKLQKRKKKVF